MTPKTPHGEDGGEYALRKRCKELFQQLGRDNMLRQNDPVETIYQFAKDLISERAYIIGFNDGYAEAMAQQDPNWKYEQ